MRHLKRGDTVEVWPMPGKRVQRHPDTFGQFLSEEGQQIELRDERMVHWLHDRLMDGSVCLHDPTPSPSDEEIAEAKKIEEARAPEASKPQPVKAKLEPEPKPVELPAKKDGDR